VGSKGHHGKEEVFNDAFKRSYHTFRRRSGRGEGIGEEVTEARLSLKAGRNGGEITAGD